MTNPSRPATNPRTTPGPDTPGPDTPGPATPAPVAPGPGSPGPGSPAPSERAERAGRAGLPQQDPDAAGRKLREVHDQLTAAVAELTSAESWQLMLRTAARLPTYSPHNVLLILSQRPDVTAVAGFRTWKQLGRSVGKGEKGIAILAPVTGRPTRATGAGTDPSGQVPGPAGTPSPPGTPAAPSVSVGAAVGSGSPARPDDPAAHAEGGASRRVAGFRVVHVFDIAQTTGPDLPQAPGPVLLEGQAPSGLLAGLTRQIHEQGYTLLRDAVTSPHPGGAVTGDRGPNGVTDFTARTVTVRPDLPDAQTAKTLAHELGHVLLHAPDRRPPGLTRPQAEVEAESLAHIVTGAHGLTSDAYSIPYLAGWSGGDLQLLAATAERVISHAHTVLRDTPPPAALPRPPQTSPGVTLKTVTRTPVQQEMPPVGEPAGATSRAGADHHDAPAPSAPTVDPAGRDRRDGHVDRRHRDATDAHRDQNQLQDRYQDGQGRAGRGEGRQR